jgi:hypothetical protein
MIWVDGGVSLGSRLPSLWIAFGVVNRDHRKPAWFDPVVDGIGEAAERRAADIPVNRRSEFGILLDAVERGFNLGQELFTKSFALPLVSGIRFVDFGLDFRLKDKRKTHRGRLACSLIASQVVTFVGLASRASSRRSSLDLNSSVISGW